MKWFNDLTHKILAHNKLLLLVALIFLLIYPLKQLNNARVCEERETAEFLSAKKGKERDDSMLGTYFRVLCD